MSNKSISLDITVAVYLRLDLLTYSPFFHCGYDKEKAGGGEQVRRSNFNYIIATAMLCNFLLSILLNTIVVGKGWQVLSLRVDMDVLCFKHILLSSNYTDNGSNTSYKLKRSYGCLF